MSRSWLNRPSFVTVGVSLVVGLAGAAVGCVGAKLVRLVRGWVPQSQDEAPNEIRHQYWSAAKASHILGWKPLFAVDEGLRPTTSWFNDFLGGYPP
jgi:nucleoside-diphosphate-sugar epimerase